MSSVWYEAGISELRLSDASSSSGTPPHAMKVLNKVVGIMINAHFMAPWTIFLTVCFLFIAYSVCWGVPSFARGFSY
jgi:hypothetical protein